MRRGLQPQIAGQGLATPAHNSKRISIFGLGYVGAVSLACLARDGHALVGVDIDDSKLALIRSGKTPVVEEGMVDLVASVAASGRVAVTTDVAEAIGATELSFVCVGTPSAPNGNQDQKAVLKLAHEIGHALQTKTTEHVIVFRSTLVPGTVEDVLIPILEQASGKREGADFHVCFQPEFLREGTSIRDYDAPPYIVVGARSDHGPAKLRSLFEHLPCEFHQTSIRAAEMVKYSCNNFHALKVTFANETARLCEALGVDPFEVMDLVCKDRQLNISPAYLRPGFAFGGSCLPKDLRATLYMSKRCDVELPLHASLLASNRLHLEHAIAKVMATGKRRIGIIGLSFKTGTDDLRESPLVLLAEHLVGKGLSVRIYDPEVHMSRLLGANRRFIDEHVPHLGSLLHDELGGVIAGSDVVVVARKETPVLRGLEAGLREDHVVLDLTNLPRNGLRGHLIGLCW